MIEVNNEKGVVVIAGPLQEILTDAARVLDAIAHKLSNEKKLDMTYDQVTEMLLEGQDAARKDREDGSVVDVMSESKLDQKKVSEVLDRMKNSDFDSKSDGGISLKQLMALKDTIEKTDGKRTVAETSNEDAEKAAKKAAKKAKKAKKAAKKERESFVFRKPQTFKKVSDA